MASRALTARGWPKIESSATTVPRRSVVLLRAASFLVVCYRRSVLSDPFGTASTVLASRPQPNRAALDASSLDGTLESTNLSRP
ncbi:hypothetical protein V6N11_082117 [Hibiscus sabdariffa]|uniref:Uncharacterized protein n=1 Tax=Hibiscus sabdariffa TaxID=183260 RepID=A0ABR2QHK1_9ROSI